MILNQLLLLLLKHALHGSQPIFECSTAGVRNEPGAPAGDGLRLPPLLRINPRIGSRCVDKGDFGPRRHSDLVGADVLGNAAGFVGRYVGIAERVQQRRLAVVHMAHHRDNRRPGNQSRILVLLALEAEFHIGFGDAFQLVAEFGDQQFRRVGIEKPCERRTLQQQREDAFLQRTRGELDQAAPWGRVIKPAHSFEQILSNHAFVDKRQLMKELEI